MVFTFTAYYSSTHLRVLPNATPAIAAFDHHPCCSTAIEQRLMNKVIFVILILATTATDTPGILPLFFLLWTPLPLFSSFFGHNCHRQYIRDETMPIKKTEVGPQDEFVQRPEEVEARTAGGAANRGEVTVVVGGRERLRVVPVCDVCKSRFHWLDLAEVEAVTVTAMEGDSSIPFVFDQISNDYGRFYASKSFYDGRKKTRILWSWVKEGDAIVKAGLAFSFQSIPRRIWLSEKGDQLVQWPVKELEKLQTRKMQLVQAMIHWGYDDWMLSESKSGECLSMAWLNCWMASALLQPCCRHGALIHLPRSFFLAKVKGNKEFELLYRSIAGYTTCIRLSLGYL
ncbi:hypothetical protein E3N88_38761 [Mikania micrantha]|uniref:Glycosyl hydrolase family 32 N-terminal domain-containing protein n=1 Tax=Mikania micrantha TaxID=192012 RepID=A0A5N6LUW5_9ASTR|nr:hypothetical protein E3N88_38761 [Mikania micrantha]